MKFSASKRALLDHCQFPFRIDTDAPFVQSKAACTGTALHARIEAFIEGHDIPSTPEDVDPATLDQMFSHWLVWWSSWEYRSLPWTAEVAFAFSNWTAQSRLLPSHGHRDYSDAKEDEICGTADLVADTDNAVFLVDWKSHNSGNQWDTMDARPQLTTLATMAARTYGKSRAKVFVVHITKNGVTVDTFDLNEDELGTEAASLCVLLDNETIPVPTPGYHCSQLRCPFLTSCPAFVETAAQVTPSDALCSLASDNLATSEKIANAWSQFQMLKKGVEQIENKIKERVEALGGVKLTNGNWLRMNPQSRDNLSAASIKRTFGEEKAKPLLESLSAAGAIETSHFKVLRETKK